MPITAPELKARLQKPLHRKTIVDAIEHHRRLRLHSTPALNLLDAGAAATRFLDFVHGLIPEDKYRIFCSLFRFPVKTVELADEIFTALEKIFDGRDPVFRYEFADPELETDWRQYRNKRLKGQRFWKTRGMEQARAGINNVLVVDLPAEQASERPEPYYYFLDIDKVLDYDLDADGEITRLIFSQGGHEDGFRIAVFDGDAYQVFASKDGAADVGPLLASNLHGLGYCPAKWFWSNPITFQHPDRKKAPLTAQLDNLDKYLFTALSKQHLDLYASYPIYWGYAQDCDYKEDTGYYCDGGFLRDDTHAYVVNRMTGALASCPACSQKRLTGAGSFIEVPPPGPATDGNDMRDPAGLVTIDRASLDYNVDEVARQRLAIYRQAVGFGGDPANDQAINEKQVMASFEGRAQKLREIAKNFEIIQAWADDTACRLRYSEAEYQGNSISYGTEFYLYTADEVLSMYQEAKAGGMDDVVLDMLQEQFWATKYRNSPEAQERVNTLLHLEPLRHLTKTEARGLYQAGQIGFTEFYIKQNFSSLIMRFERENTDVRSFGSLLEFDEKINRINEILDSYVPVLQQAASTSSSEDIQALRSTVETYGIAVRAGAITPQQIDEETIRLALSLPPLSGQALAAWQEDGGVRRPITIKSDVEKQAEIDNLT
jgi:hypothetical protein